ncbi:MAG: hypothetical protein AB7G08_28450 [Hyphomicrobiaceae bacterium]
MQFEAFGTTAGEFQGPRMSLSRRLLIAEAERLVARAEREVKRHRRAAHTDVARRAERELQRLQLYRAVVRNVNTAHAIMPEYAVARGFVDPIDARQETT